MEKIKVLEKVLGTGHKTNKDYYQFNCPFCFHKKPKLGISINNGNWKCWVCDEHGNTVVGLFKKLNIDAKSITLASELWKDKQPTKPQISTPQLTLPAEFQPLWKPNLEKQSYKNAFRYALSRRITAKDILKHRIGFCDSGKYSGYLLFPNYDSNFNLNFYYGRAFVDGIEPHVLAPVNKNIIGDDWLINWNYEEICLVESKINAITLKRNVTTMFGKLPSEHLKQKIIESDSIKNIFVILDGDAQKEIKQISDYFVKHGKSVFEVKLSEEDDINSIGYEKSWQKIKSSTQTNPEQIFKQKLFDKLKKI